MMCIFRINHKNDTDLLLISSQSYSYPDFSHISSRRCMVSMVQRCIIIESLVCAVFLSEMESHTFSKLPY